VAKFSFSQSLQKGNLLGLHVMTIDLKPNATMDQFRTFYITKLIPEYEKHMQGAKGYIVDAIRGENANSMGIIWLFTSEKARDKYFNPDGSPTALGNQQIEKLTTVDQQLEKIATYTTKYTDWVVQ
jgi:hypothetical protein